jgi:hypothetical protein
VGWYLNGTGSRRPLIERWNGLAWKVVPIPGVGTGDNFLWSVNAASGANAWTVGWSQSGTGNQTILEHWDGTAWKRVASPDPGGSSGDNNTLWGVAGKDCASAWAVGYYSDAAGTHALALHC